MSARPQLPYSDSLRLLLAQSLDLGHRRIDLLLFELVDERARLGRLLQYSLSMAVLAILCLQLLVLLVVAATWDSHWRLPMIAALAAMALIALYLTLQRWHAVPPSRLLEARDNDDREAPGPRPAAAP